MEGQHQCCRGIASVHVEVASVLQRLFSTVRDSISTVGIAPVHVGDSISTAEAVQYCGG